MDQAGEFLHAVRAVERGVASDEQARSVLCFARLSRRRRYVTMARRLIERRQWAYWAAAGVVTASLLLLVPIG